MKSAYLVLFILAAMLVAQSQEEARYHVIQLKQINFEKTIDYVKTNNGLSLNGADSDHIPSLKVYKARFGDQIKYRIKISHNDGENSLKNITVTDMLPQNLDYLNSTIEYIKIESSDQKVIRAFPKLDVSGKVLLWNIDEIEPRAIVYIYVTTIALKDGFDIFENRAMIIGEWQTKIANINTLPMNVTTQLRFIDEYV
jgi:uncharacterized repeat protein (TIGR01451 family)